MVDVEEEEAGKEAEDEEAEEAEDEAAGDETEEEAAEGEGELGLVRRRRRVRAIWGLIADAYLDR